MNEKTEILNDIENELARLEGAIHGNDGDAISFLRGQVMKVIKMEESEHPSPALQDAVKEFQIDFGGNVLSKITVNDSKINVLLAMDGYGNAIPLDSIIVTETLA